MDLSTAEEMFASRALDYEVAVQCGADFINGQFRFAYVRGGELKFTKVRDPAKTYHFIEPAGAELFLWGIDDLADVPDGTDDVLVLTEGEPDRIAVIQARAGVHVVSVPNGGRPPGKSGPQKVVVSEDKGFSYLWTKDEKLIPEIAKFKKIILWTDDDEVGWQLRDELALRIGPGLCWHVPSIKEFGAKDANDALIRWGTEGVRRLLAKAIPMRPGTLLRPSELPPRQFERQYTSGWEWLDKNLILKRPELVVVTGIPGHGKGTWVRALCCNLAERHGLRTAFLTPEDPPYVVKRSLIRHAMRHYSHPTPEQQDAAHEFIDEHSRISLPPEDETITMDFVKAEMASAALHHNCQIFVLDPWNEVSHDYGRQNATQYIEHVLVDLKQHMRRYGLILFLVAHPRKMPTGRAPTLYDISDSANWANKADHGIIIHRMTIKGDDNDDEIMRPLSDVSKIIVGKSKDHETMGKPGDVRAKYDPNKADYIHVENGK
jgi:twinkle protein